MRITLLSILILTITLIAVPATAEEETFPTIQAPETIEEAQEFGLQILQGIPGAVQEVWKTQAVPLWTDMWSIAKNIWDTTVFSWVKGLWDQALSILGQEIEKRQPLFEEEFEKEKEQLKKELEENTGVQYRDNEEEILYRVTYIHHKVSDICDRLDDQASMLREVLEGAAEENGLTWNDLYEEENHY